MSGANIRNAAVRAAFMASAQNRTIDMTICMAAAERECREMGLLVRSQLQEVPREEEAITAEPQPARPAAKLVPITHRR
jgi:hypothetical protein